MCSKRSRTRAFIGIAANTYYPGFLVSDKIFYRRFLSKNRCLYCILVLTPIDTEREAWIEVQQLCLYMHDPREPHLNAMKRVLRYLRGTTDLGL
ncbi:ribonuclease H-like domain-containing protein [Tanacetum coccineum]